LQQVKFRLHLCGTPLREVADSAASLSFCILADMTDILPFAARISASSPLRILAELIAEHLAVSFQIVDILLGTILVFLQILIGLDTVLGRKASGHPAALTFGYPPAENVRLAVQTLDTDDDMKLVAIVVIALRYRALLSSADDMPVTADSVPRLFRKGILPADILQDSV
jgi:hypothetical protein